MKILEGIKKHMTGLVLLSFIISYFSLQIAVYISYAIDGILFHNISQMPEYLKSILEMGTLKGLLCISAIMIGINLMVAGATYIRERLTTAFTLKVSSNLKEKLYSHILNLEYESYQSYSKVEMLQRVNEDARGICQFL